MLKTKPFILAAVCACLTGVGHSAKGAILPRTEWAMIRQTAANYDLSDDATWLLAAIRKHENGRPGLEFGIGGPMNNGHPSHRFRDGIKSFYVQAAWAAGTIRRHYTGDVYRFANRYNPKAPDHWARCVSSVLRQLKAENQNALPGARPVKRDFDFMK